MKKFLFILTLFFGLVKNVNAQKKIVSFEIDNKSNLSDSIYSKVIKNSKNAVIFICPIRNNKKELYIEKALKFSQITTLKNDSTFILALIFFNEDKKNNSKNPVLRSKSGKDSIIISQLECYAYNGLKRNLDRSTKLSGNVINHKIVFEGEKLSKLEIVDSTVCFNDLSSRITFYQNYISQLYQPKYSIDEKIDMINDSIFVLRHEIDSLKLYIKKQNDLYDKRDRNLNETKDKKK